jgi:HD-like signal output (HDOD) protein
MIHHPPTPHEKDKEKTPHPNPPEAQHPHPVEVASKLLNDIGIPPAPTVFMNVRKELNKPFPDMDLLAAMITHDPGIASRVLQVANSSFFGDKEHVHSIKEAFIRLGLRTFQEVIASTYLRKQSLISEEANHAFASHSEKTAQAIHFISRQIKPSFQEKSYILGLFHDCAVSVLLRKDPDYVDFLPDALSRSSTIIEDELQAFHTSHCILGALVTRAWGVDNEICEAIEHHHALRISTELDPPVRILLALLVLAEIMASHSYNPEQRAGIFPAVAVVPIFNDIYKILKTDAHQLNDLHRECTHHLHNPGILQV